MGSILSRSWRRDFSASSRGRQVLARFGDVVADRDPESLFATLAARRCEAEHPGCAVTVDAQHQPVAVVVVAVGGDMHLSRGE